MQRNVLLSVLCVPLVLAALQAQEPASSSPQDDKDKPAAKPADQKPNGGPPREEHVIYVPYTKLPEVFEKEGASVLLPYAQFLQMWSGMQGPIIPLPIKPPVAGLISRADYSGKVEGDLVRLQATLTIEVLGDEWARLPVQFGDAAVGEAMSDDEDVLLRGVGDGKYELLAHGRGKHKISFELVARVQASADGKNFTINCPLVGVSNLELEIDQPEMSVQVNPRRTSQVQATDKKVTKVQAAIGSTDKFTVAWQPKSGAAAEMAGLASVTDTIQIEVGDGVVHTHATFDFQVLRGSLDALAVTMPADQRLLDVQAPGLRDWQSEAAEEGRQRLTVRLHAATRDKVRLEVRTESPIPEKAFPIAQFQAVGVARESGIVAVRSAEDVGLEFVTHSGVSRIDAAEVPEALRKPRSTFYKFFTPSFQLAVAASALEPRVAVESFLTVTIEKARLSLRGDFKFDVTRAGIFAVPLRLPAGFNVDEVVCDVMDRHESSTPDDGDGQVLTVYLTKKVLGQLKLAVVASQSRQAGTQSGELELPLIEPIGVPREQGLVAVIAPDSIEVNSDPTKLESARAATPAELAARGFTPQPPAGSTVAASFAFTRRPVKIGLATRERPRRVFASVSTVASVKEDIFSVTTKINYDIQYAGLDTFRFAVPASAKPEITVDGKKEHRKADDPEEDGSVVWTVVLHSEALGSRTVTVTYDEKITVPEKGVSQLVQPIRVLDVDRETGEIAILKDRSLAIGATQEGLEEIDARELTQPVGKEQPYLSYRYFRHPAKLTLEVTKHEIEGVVKTVVSRAFVEAVVSSEGPISVRARYMVKSSERQRLALTLPATRVLGVTVAGRSVLPEKAPAMPGAGADDKSYFINIDRETGPDVAFPIAIVYEAPPPPGDKLAMTDALPVRLPQFEKGVKFQQLYVRLWLPDQFRAVGEPSGFTSETRSVFDAFRYQQVTYAAEDPESAFRGDTTTFDFRTAGHSYLFSSLSPPPELAVRYWKTAPMTLAGSLVVLAIGALLVFCRFEAKVLLVLAAALLALLAGLFWREAVLSWLAAARIGLASVIALWLVLFLLRVRRAIPLRMAAAGAGTVLLSAVGTSATAAPAAPPTSPESAASQPDSPAQPADAPPASTDSTEKGGRP
jgi:hypothetical protein